VNKIGVEAIAHRNLGHGSAWRRACGDDLPLQLSIVTPAAGQLGHLTCLVSTILAAGYGPFKVSWPDGYGSHSAGVFECFSSGRRPEVSSPAKRFGPAPAFIDMASMT
jgi:hypothetical protein